MTAQDPLAALTESERAQYERYRSSLLGSGFIVGFERRGKRLAPGVRVSHCGERRAAAYREGTATVVQVFHEPSSQWEKDWGRPNVEVLALTDRDRFGLGRVAGWADYHCVVSEVQP